MPETPTLAQSIAAHVADLYVAGGSSILAPHPVFHAAANGDPVKLGMCIAASLIQRAMCEHEEGLAVFGNHLHKPSFHDFQGK